MKLGRRLRSTLLVAFVVLAMATPHAVAASRSVTLDPGTASGWSNPSGATSSSGAATTNMAAEVLTLGGFDTDRLGSVTGVTLLVDASQEDNVDDLLLVSASASGCSGVGASPNQFQPGTSRATQSIGLSCGGGWTWSAVEALTIALETEPEGGFLGVGSIDGTWSVHHVRIKVDYTNDAPVADAGLDEEVLEGSVVALSGAGSDPEGASVSFSWTQTGGPGVTLADAGSAQATFTAPSLDANEPEALTFKLTVTDDEGLSGTDTVVVTVTNQNRPPTASAGPDKEAIVGDTVRLDGGGSDPDGDDLDFTWAQTDGPAASLSSAHNNRPTFTPDSAGTYRFQLTVEDGQGGVATDSMLVSVTELPAAQEESEEPADPVEVDGPDDPADDPADSPDDSPADGVDASGSGGSSASDAPDESDDSDAPTEGSGATVNTTDDARDSRQTRVAAPAQRDRGSAVPVMDVPLWLLGLSGVVLFGGVVTGVAVRKHRTRPRLLPPGTIEAERVSYPAKEEQPFVIVPPEPEDPEPPEPHEPPEPPEPTTPSDPPRPSIVLGDLEQELRNEELLQFLNNASHDLASPLTPIRLQLSLLTKIHGQSLDDKQRKALEVVTRNVDQMGLLITDLKDAARLQAGHMDLFPEPMGLAALARDAFESFEEPCREKGVRLRLDAPDETPIRGDAGRLTQVFYNLINNALKFTDEGGTIQVAVKPTGDGRVLAAVRDTGIGMSEEDAAKLFAPFAQAHSSAEKKKGSGLGLFICKGIVEGHGGDIWCESPGPGKGSVFAFTVPLADGVEGEEK